MIRTGVQPTTVLLGLAAATLLAVQVTTAQGPVRESGASEPALITQVLHPGVAPAVDDAATRGPSKGDDAQAPGAAPPAGLTINAIFDATITGDPNAAAIENAINAAIANYQAKFADPITVTINFASNTMGLGQSQSYFSNLPYSTFLAALKADATSSDDFTAISLLPDSSTNPVNGATTINVKTANLRAVGIAAFPPMGQPDGFITVNTTITNPGTSGTTGDYNLGIVVEHEIDEVLGLGSSLPAITNATIFPEDLYRYDQNGARTFAMTSTITAFFSIDDMTALDQFDNQNDGGDFGDWQSNPLPFGVSPEVQDAFATPHSNPALGVELTALDVIGYDRVRAVVRRSTAGDFDGDGKADVTVFRPSTGTWYIRYSATGTYSAIAWGGAGDIPVAADYDGDGKADVAVFRPSNGTWYIRYSATGTFAAIAWGGAGDVPVPADYDGDGKADVVIFRPSNGTWYIQYSTGTFAALGWGAQGDVPVPSDYDGDGKTDIAVFRPSNGTWYIRYSATLTVAALPWGGAGDIAVPGDYDGDGKTDIAIFRPSTGVWYLLYSGTQTGAAIGWGAMSDIAVPGDYDGDGKTDVAIFRPSNGTWYIRYSATLTAAAIPWGGSGDVPILGR